MNHLDAALVAALFLLHWLVRRWSYRRALTRVRTMLAQARGERDDALDIIDSLRAQDEALAVAVDEPIPYAPVEGQPVWTTGAPPEAINDEFREIMRVEWLGGER